MLKLILKCIYMNQRKYCVHFMCIPEYFFKYLLFRFMVIAIYMASAG